jgi:hypothetical protein
MISSLLWIPAGVANPHPRKYEFSTTEQELIQQLMVTPTLPTPPLPTTTLPTSSESANISKELTLDIPNRRTDATNNENDKKNGVSVSKRTIQHPKIRPSHNLPPDLRMDEYSSDDNDDDDNDNEDEAEDDQNQNHENEEMRCQKNAAAIGRLLVGNHDNDTGKNSFPPNNSNINSNSNNNNNSDDDDDDDDEMENDTHSVMDDHDQEPHSSQHGELKENQHHLPNTTNRYHDDDDDDDDDDDLADVPDTREFEPLDVQGLEAMGISHTTTTTTTDVEDRIQQRWNYDLLQEPGCVPVLHPDDDDDRDNDSEADDVALTPDDALIVVAKTEDVRLL